MILLRDYQAHTIDEVRARFLEHHRSVCIVAPTGAGKSVLCAAMVKGHQLQPSNVGTLVVVPRIELVQQMAGHLRTVLPEYDVGVIAPGQSASPASLVQISTIQTLLSRGIRPPASLLVLDEAHHYAADLWATILKDYPTAYTVGLTATPERQDGRALGDLFTALVVAAPYSKLIDDGYLVECQTFAPEEIVKSGLAQDPVAAYLKHTPAERAFVFCQRVAQARELAQQFNEHGVPAACVTDKTPRAERIQALEQFRSGTIRVLTNVFCLTEGVDIPAASVCILARTVGHHGAYLQMVGRVLRPAQNKQHATLIDLTGAVHLHGLPTQDREYALDGEAIRCEKLPSLRTCQACGYVMEGRPEACKQCGFVFPVQEQPELRIYSLELRRVYAGDDTPTDAKIKERDRLVELALRKNFGLYFVVKEYKRLFNAHPSLRHLPDEVKAKEWERLCAAAATKGYKHGWASWQFKNLFGHWPNFTRRAA